MTRSLGLQTRSADSVSILPAVVASRSLSLGFVSLPSIGVQLNVGSCNNIAAHRIAYRNFEYAQVSI